MQFWSAAPFLIKDSMLMGIVGVSPFIGAAPIYPGVSEQSAKHEF
jgi:hypothetical protein